MLRRMWVRRVSIGALTAALTVLGLLITGTGTAGAAVCNTTAYYPVPSGGGKVNARSRADCSGYTSGWLKSTLVLVRTFAPDVNIASATDSVAGTWFDATAQGCGASGATRGYKTVYDTSWGQCRVA